MIFARERTQECLAHFAATQNAPNTKKPNRTLCITTKAAGLGGRGVRPSPQARPNGAYTTKAARPSGRCIRSLNFKERKKNIVKPKQKAIRKSGCRLSAQIFHKSLILLTLCFLFLFKKEKIKGGEKRKRKNFLLGDFDVFASCFLSSPRA